MADRRDILRTIEKVASEIGGSVKQNAKSNWWDGHNEIHCVRWKETRDGTEFEHEQCQTYNRQYYQKDYDKIPDGLPVKKTS